MHSPYRIIILVSLLCAAVGLSAQRGRPVLPITANATAADLPVGELNRIRNLVRFGDTQEAINLFESMLAQQPNWVPALTERSLLFTRLGRDAEARLDKERAMRINPEATQFYLARGSFDLLDFIALYPRDWFADNYSTGQLSETTGGATDTYGQQRNQLTTTEGDDATLRFLRLKMDGDSPGLNSALLGSVADHSRQWRDLMMGNLALLRQDAYRAIQFYDDAVLSGADWPELYYNRGLANVLNYNYISGCDDLKHSYEAGYEPARVMLSNLCTY